MRLYHYTCSDHGADGIRADGRIIPAPIYFAPDAPRVVWLTDLAVPDRARLGLTSLLLSCDRTEVRFEVDCEAERWKHFARRHGINGRVRRDLERFGDPYHWFVSTLPVGVGTALATVVRREVAS